MEIPLAIRLLLTQRNNQNAINKQKSPAISFFYSVKQHARICLLLNDNNVVFVSLFLFHVIFKWQMFAETKKKPTEIETNCTKE